MAQLVSYRKDRPLVASLDHVRRWREMRWRSVRALGVGNRTCCSGMGVLDPTIGDKFTSGIDRGRRPSKKTNWSCLHNIFLISEPSNLNFFSSTLSHHWQIGLLDVRASKKGISFTFMKALPGLLQVGTCHEAPKGTR